MRNAVAPEERLARLVAWLERLPARAWIVSAILVILVVSAISAAENSLVVDGTRYFWLDDDQMISMRYGRNLARGFGLVWNPGERVEGYTNPLWTVVMAAAHLLPVDDAHTSLVIRVINAALACLVLVLTWRLARRMLGAVGLAGPAALVVVALSHELLFWSMHGFETTLLTVVFLTSVVRLLDEADRGREHVATYLCVGLLPLVRSDGFHLWIAAAIVALGLAKSRPAVFRRLALAATLPVAHLVFRSLYYGEWLPNTYYLKVAGHAAWDRLGLGVSYLAYFFLFYWLATFLALLGVAASRDRRRSWLLAGVAISACYALWVGGDNFIGARFLAPQAPVLVLLAAAGIRTIAGERRIVEFALAAALGGSYLAITGFLAFFGSGYTWIANPNGGSPQSLVSALAISRGTLPEARVAVHAAGIVPYFSRRYSIDWLGKTDPWIARIPTRKSAMAHDKFDPQHSLIVREADLAVMLWLPSNAGSCSAEARAVVQQAAPPWVRDVYLSAAFQSEFCGNAIELPGAVPIYVRRGSKNVLAPAQWRTPRVGS